jgi:hypothetical protein
MDNGGHHLRRRWGSLFTKECHRSLQGGRHVNKQSIVWQRPSYLRESLPLNILQTLFQCNHLGSQRVDHFTMLLLIILEDFDLLGLLLSLPDKIIDHIGQLLDLDLLCINMTVQLVNNPPYAIRRITDKVNTFLQTISRMVLLTINMSNLVVQNMDLCQELSPYGSGILGVSLAPHLALPLFWLEETMLQQTVQWTRKPLCYYLDQRRNRKETDTSKPVLLSRRNKACIACA